MGIDTDIASTAEYFNGQAAHENGCVLTENPYNERTQQDSFGLWMMGWTANYDRFGWPWPWLEDLR